MDQVVYYSMGGNTKKLADAIAEELNVSAESVKTSTLKEGPGIVFLGTGCYGGKPGLGMSRFIDSNNFKGRKVALFGTSGGGLGLELKAIVEALKEKGASVIGSYDCKGKVLLTFNLYNRGHPDTADLEGARKFARAMSGKNIRR
jgi:flavodoxin